MSAYDAFLLVSFGGPEGPGDVIPFLENVTRGRGVPRERLEEVAEHYYRFGGISPINQQCRDLLAAVEKDFAASGIDLPVYWGNRNWDPMLADAVAAMAADGRRHAVAFVTSAYSSYSSCRQYLENIEQARAEVANAIACRLPSAAMAATVSASIGSQFRLPQYTGRSMPLAAKSFSTAVSRSRHCWLIGLTPPNR